MKIDDKLNEIKGIYGIGSGDTDFLDVSPNHDYLEFDINNTKISFQNVLNYLNTMGLSSVVLRIPQLIDKQLSKLYNAFSHAITKYDYPSHYSGVFPVKVNHNAAILESISQYGASYGHGFECGTKPELLIVVNLRKHDTSSLIICNGTKDDDYIDAALSLTKLGYNIIISIESIRELRDLIRLSQQRGIRPQIGLRIKMNQRVEGHWGHSSGLFSKFGLSASELSEVVSELKIQNYLDCIRLLHAHLGSQINKVTYFKRAVTEIIGYYQKLFELGATGLRYVNLGGGLGIDYEGNYSASNSGIAYNFEQYADIIVSTIITSLKTNPAIIPPDIITESGRAITATSSLLLVEILENRSILPEVNQFNIYSSPKIDLLEKDFLSRLSKIRSLKQIENFCVEFDKQTIKVQEEESFWIDFHNQKDVELLIATIHKHLLVKIKVILEKNDKFYDLDLENQFPLVFKLLTTYTADLVGNFSVFRGACDIVLADQYFPIIPTVGLHSTPKTLNRLVDITCDSDGEVVTFITKTSRNVFSQEKMSLYFAKDGQLIRHPSKVVYLNGIPLPDKNTKPGSYIAIALTGAYQDTVQFDQNLLGELPEVELKVDSQGAHFKIIAYAESNSDLITNMKHNISTIDSLEHLLFSNPYVNNKASSVRSIDLLGTKSDQPDKDFSESNSINFN